MARPENFGAQYLQRRLDADITLAKHIGIIVEEASDSALVLRAPLERNANHLGSAFGGSLYSLAVLSGWAWLTRNLAARELKADVVIQESNIQFLAPIRGEIRASIKIPAQPQVDKFHKMLARSGRGRLKLRVEMRNDAILACVFDGLFAASMRR
jgi:thioesterase domain-containing protein